jgi:hypothetical protein
MAAHGASGRLESILTDTSVPLAKRSWAAATIELGMLTRLAAPETTRTDRAGGRLRGGAYSGEEKS